jgi:SMI1-KNR4 cell-wall
MSEVRGLLLTTAPPPLRPVDPSTPEGWAGVERQLCCSLPGDYKWLINTYGSGEFCDLLVILNPFATAEGMNLLSQMSPVLTRYRLGGLRNRAFPCFPAEGGLFPVAQDTNGGDIFWLTHGCPDEWHLVFFNHGEYQQHTMGLATFIARWISGLMPESFFGNGNNAGIIRRDPVFCPAGQVRPPRPANATYEPLASRVGVVDAPTRSPGAQMMGTPEEAIAWFNAQGYFAWAMDVYSPGALFAATSARTDKSGASSLQGGLVAVFPKDGAWMVGPLPDMGMGPLFEPMSFQSLEQAVKAARDLIHGNSSDPAEKARIRAEERIGKKIWDPDIWK